MDNWLEAKMAGRGGDGGAGKHHPSCVAAAADAVRLSFEEMRPLDGAHPFYAASAFRGIHRPGRSQGTPSPAVCVGWRRDRATRGLGPHHPGRSRLAGKVSLRRSLAIVSGIVGFGAAAANPRRTFSTGFTSRQRDDTNPDRQRVIAAEPNYEPIWSDVVRAGGVEYQCRPVGHAGRRRPVCGLRGEYRIGDKTSP